ncbi:hypothetical protein F5Y09DRAFT_305765 [Xylaria sp. FL1042]|nr:hypothetical protein F5Y09DRAFT_305765 [Xylaria sp. FL1042]
MAYRGKPSAACERCRFRRLKCDHEIPSCTQCIRAKVGCSGYRNPLDLNFRDQSEEIARNYRLPLRKKRQKTPIVASPRDDTAAAETPAIISENHLAHSVQNLAQRYSFANYMTGGPRCGRMSYLASLMEDPRNTAVNTALDAVALAAFSNVRLSPGTMLKAQREYTVALSRTNRALKDPIMCKTDDTLAAVVLLGIYEVINCTDDSYIDRWLKHMDGAAKLVEIRGSEQLTRREGLDMFTHLRTQINLSRIYQEKYISPTLAQLTEEVKQYRDPNDRILDDLATTIIRLTNFCADIKNRCVVEPSEIIRTALIIDAELVSLLISVPPHWSYTTIQIPRIDGKRITNAVWGSHYHIYGSITAASMWNNYRSARIIIQELIYDTLTDLDGFMKHNTISFPQQHSLIDQCRQTMLQLGEDICASVPFHFGLGINDNHMSQDSLSPLSGAPNTAPDAATSSSFLSTLSNPPVTSNTSDGGLSLGTEAWLISRLSSSELNSNLHLSDHLGPFEIVGAGGLTLMWPLLVAANSGVASKELRDWVITCLDKIGHSMGINQALAMAKLLREGMQSRAWLVPDYGSPSHSM